MILNFKYIIRGVKTPELEKAIQKTFDDRLNDWNAVKQAGKPPKDNITVIIEVPYKRSDFHHMTYFELRADGEFYTEICLYGWAIDIIKRDKMKARK